MTRGKNGGLGPIVGDEQVKRTELGNYYRRRYFTEFWDAEKEQMQKDGVVNDPTMILARLNRFLEAKLVKSDPTLNPREKDEWGKLTEQARQARHELNSLLHSVRPGYNQLVEMWLELYDPSSDSQSTLENSTSDRENEGVATRARTREVNKDPNNDGNEGVRLRETESIILGDAVLREAVTMARQTGKPIGECVRELRRRNGHGD